MDDAHPHHAAAVQINIGKVDGVADVAVFQIVLELIHRHNGAVLLTLRGRGAQVRHGHHMGGAHQAVIGEVGDVSSHPAGVQSRQHGVVVHNLAPGQVDEPNAPLHGGDSRLVDHMGGLFRVVDVDGDIICPLVELLNILDHMDVPVQPQRRVHGQEGVVAIDVHAHVQRYIGHQRADGAQANDAQRFFIKLRAHKGGLALFHDCGDVHTRFHLLADPLDTAVHVPGTHQHGAQHQLLDRVGVGTGGVEHRDAGFRAAVDGDVVDAHTGSGDGQQGIGEGVVVELGGADEDTVLTGLVVGVGVVLRLHPVQAHGRDLVECFYAIHGTMPPGWSQRTTILAGERAALAPLHLAAPLL